MKPRRIGLRNSTRASKIPNLWDNPENAQKLMRERQMLVDAIETYESIKTDLSDNIELIELGEMEEDEEVVARRRRRDQKLQGQSRQERA